MFNRHNTDHDGVTPFSDATPAKLGLRFGLLLRGKLNREGHLGPRAYMVKRGLSRLEAAALAGALKQPRWRETAPKGADGKAVNRCSNQPVYRVHTSASHAEGKTTWTVVATPNRWRADATFSY